MTTWKEITDGEPLVTSWNKRQVSSDKELLQATRNYSANCTSHLGNDSDRVRTGDFTGDFRSAFQGKKKFKSQSDTGISEKCTTYNCEKLQQRKRLCVAPEINNYTTDVNEYKIYICIHCTVSKHTFHDKKKRFLDSARNVWFCKKHTKLTGPRLERAILRQAKRVPNDNGSSVSTVGELNPRESSGGNSSRSIP